MPGPACPKTQDHYCISSSQALNKNMMDGWFGALQPVFQSYQDDGRVNMKDSVQ